MHRAEHPLLGFDRPLLRLVGPCLGPGDALANLVQPLLALRLLGFELSQARGLAGAPLRLFGALLDLAQALLRLNHRPFLRFALVLELLLSCL
jgi:hypothetical protein